MIELTFEPRIPLSLWVPLAAAAAAALAWYAAALRNRLDARRWAAIAGLMALASALPLALLLNPTWVRRIPPPAGKPRLTVLVDGTASMHTADVAGAGSRYEAASDIAASIHGHLAERYQVDIRLFAERSRPASLEQLKAQRPEGQITDLAEAIEESLDEGRPQGQAILLVSDGIHNAPGGMARVRQSAAKAKAMAAPIYTVTVGGEAAVRDLEVRADRPRELAFAGQRVPVRVTLVQRGSLARQTELALMLDGRVIERRAVELAGDGQVEEVFHLRQSESGLYRYSIRAAAVPGEVTAANNRAVVMLRVVDEPIRVLLLEGKPYWDTKFLIRTLARDPSVELTSVVRVAEGRFLQRRVARRTAAEGGTAGGAAERAGASKSPPASDIISVRSDAADILADGRTLATYQIVFLGRGAETFLSDAAVATVERWLKRQESALVCFRGAPAAEIGQRLGRLMPVRWSPGQETRFRVRMTDAGRNLGWLDARELGGGGLASLPSLAAVARPQLKNIAETLAEAAADNGDRTVPVISYRRVGMGRVVVVEGAGMWRWAFLPPQYQKETPVYAQLWRSLTRWLATDVQLLPSEEVALRLDRVTFDTTQPVAGDLLVRPERVGGRVPQVELTGTGLSRPRVFSPAPSGSDPGRFRVVFGQLPEGQYTARAIFPDEKQPACTAAFDVRRGNLREVLEVDARPDQMQWIAELSGGSVLAGGDPQQLAERFDRFLAQNRPERTVRATAWDRWWVLAAALALWGTGWALRRRSGLV